MEIKKIKSFFFAAHLSENHFVIQRKHLDNIITLFQKPKGNKSNYVVAKRIKFCLKGNMSN